MSYVGDCPPPLAIWYLQAFVNPDEAFVTYYSIGADKSLVPTTYTRGDIFLLARKAAAALASFGLGYGDR